MKSEGTTFGGEGKDWRITKINKTINLTSLGIRAHLPAVPTTMYILYCIVSPRFSFLIGQTQSEINSFGISDVSACSPLTLQ